MNRRDFCNLAAAVPLAAALRPRSGWAATTSPLSLPLASASSLPFTFLGTFNLPQSNIWQYGAGALSVSNGVIYANGLDQGTLYMGAAAIPSSFNGGTASVVTDQTAISTSGATLGNNPVCTGSLVYNNKLYVTGAMSYDASGTQVGFMTNMNPNFTNQGAWSRAAGSAGNIDRMFSNSMNIVPAAWQPILGGPAYVAGGPGGMSGLSIISKQCCGYGFSTFNPANVASGSAVALTEWLNYPYANTSGNGEQISVLSGYSPATKSNWGGQAGDNYVSAYDRPIGCAFIPDGTRSLVYLHCHAYGPGGNPGSSPCGPGASGSNETPIAPDTKPYVRIQISAYDLASIVSNRQSGGAPSAPRPYGWWELPAMETQLGGSANCPINHSWNSNAWAAYDPVAQSDGSHLLYVHNGYPGTIYVWKVGSLSSAGAPPPPPPVLPDPPSNVKVS